MSKLLPCANKATMGCSETITQRGVIYCNSCIEIKKSNSKVKRETELDEIINKNKSVISALEEKIRFYITNEEGFKLQIEQYQTKIKELELEESTDYSSNEYNSHLEKENERISSLLSKYLEENEKLTKEKSIYERTFEQTKLDINKMKIEHEKLFQNFILVSEDNEKLQKENNELIRFQEELSSKVTNVKDRLQKTVNQVETINKENPIENETTKPVSEKLEVDSSIHLNLSEKKFKKNKNKKK